VKAYFAFGLGIGGDELTDSVEDEGEVFVVFLFESFYFFGGMWEID